MDIPWKADIAVRTDAGRVRQENQDMPIVDSARGLFAVSDGMGGLPFGGETARVAAEMMPALLDELTGLSPQAAALALKDGIESISNAIRDFGNSEYCGTVFGATLSGFAVVNDCAVIFNMGDSRVYRLRNGEMESLTQDHSVAQILLDAGELTPEEVKRHPAKSRITRFLGMLPEAMADLSGVDIQPGDRFLVCSDGLHGMVADDQLRRVLSADAPAADICEELIRAANEAGGTDNITAVVWIAMPTGEECT